MRRQYGIETRVTAEGIELPDLGCVRPLGMHAETEVWGVWTGSPDDPPVKVRDVSQPSEVSNPQFKHLVLSTTHPRHWVSCFRLTALLKDQPGTLLELLKVLKRLDVNIISTECTFTGYNQTRFDAICTCGRDNRLAEVERHLRPEGAESDFARKLRNDTRVNVLRAVGYEMLGTLALIEAEIMLANAELIRREPDRAFLSRAMVERGSLPWFINSFSWGKLSEFFRVAAERGVDGVHGRSTEAFTETMIALQHQLASDTISASWRDRLGMPRSTIAAECSYAERLERPGDEDAGPSIQEQWIRDALRRLHMRHWTHPVNATGLIRLAYCGVFRDFRHDPIRMSVTNSGGRWLLKYRGPRPTFLDELREVNPAESGSTQHDFGDHPLGLMSIASADSCARVRFVRESAVGARTARVSVRYAIPTREARANEPPVGLLASVLQGVERARGNVERITSRTLAESEGRVEGRIELIVIHDWRLPQDDSESWRGVIRREVDRELGAYCQQFASPGSDAAIGATASVESNIGTAAVETA